MAMTDKNGSVLSPRSVASVNAADIMLLPESLKALKEVEKTILNVDGFASHERITGASARFY
jgi:hypothetical protein